MDRDLTLLHYYVNDDGILLGRYIYIIREIGRGESWNVSCDKKAKEKKKRKIILNKSV